MLVGSKLHGQFQDREQLDEWLQLSSRPRWLRLHPKQAKSQLNRKHDEPCFGNAEPENSAARKSRGVATKLHVCQVLDQGIDLHSYWWLSSQARPASPEVFFNNGERTFKEKNKVTHISKHCWKSAIDHMLHPQIQSTHADRHVCTWLAQLDSLCLDAPRHIFESIATLDRRGLLDSGFVCDWRTLEDLRWDGKLGEDCFLLSSCSCSQGALNEVWRRQKIRRSVPTWPFNSRSTLQDSSGSKACWQDQKDQINKTWSKHGILHSRLLKRSHSEACLCKLRNQPDQWLSAKRLLCWLIQKRILCSSRKRTSRTLSRLSRWS